MGSNLVVNTAQTYCNTVESFFRENLPEFSLVEKYAYSPYWDIVFECKYVKIKIGGDIGFSIEILIDGTSFPLWQYDRSVNNKITTSIENILYQLKVLKRFLNEVGY